MKRFTILLPMMLFAFLLYGCTPTGTTAVTTLSTTFTGTYYTVSFDTDGGNAVASIQVAENGLIAEPIDPVKSNLEFGGWYADEDLTDPWNFGSDRVTGNITLYAKFIELVEITGMSFEDDTVTYDGFTKTLLVTGSLPAGVTVSYTGNIGTNAGVYNATATLSGSGYETLVLEATLMIEKADLEGIVFEDAFFEYDGYSKSLVISSNLPIGVTVIYDGNDETAVGEYDVVAHVNGGTNFNSVEMTAKLTIYALEEELFSIGYGTSVYFQNNMDDNRLYMYDFALTEDNLSKVNNDTPQYFALMAGEIYYRSSGIFAAIAKLRTDGAKVNVMNANAQFIVSDGTYLYYAVNSFFGESGIYRLSIAGEEPVAIRIADVKAKFLVVDNAFVYFSNDTDGGKLYKVPKLQAGVVAPTLVHDEQVAWLVLDDDILYFTQNTLTNDTICSIKVDGTDFATISNDNGKYLVKNGGYIYYSNVDLLTSTIFGKGIYRVAISTGVSEKVLDDDSVRVSSLMIYDGKLFFYKVDDKHFYCIDLTTRVLVDLMDGFIPEDEALLGMSGTTAVYGNYIYFQNFYDDHKLYRYDAITGIIVRVTSIEVDEIVIEGDSLYYRAVSYFFNKDLYRINLLTGEQILVTTDDIGEIAVFNGRIYAVDYSGSNRVISMNTDGSGMVALMDGEATNLRVYENQLYLIVDEYIYRMDLNGGNYTQLSSKKAIEFEIANDVIYFRMNGIFSNKLSKIDTDGTDEEDLASVDPKSINIIGNTIFFYNDHITAWGIYTYTIGSASDPIMILKSVAENIVIREGKMYYYKSSSGDLINGDGHFYSLNLDGTDETKIR